MLRLNAIGRSSGQVRQAIWASVRTARPQDALATGASIAVMTWK
jgi:hypothetical protein